MGDPEARNGSKYHNYGSSTLQFPISNRLSIFIAHITTILGMITAADKNFCATASEQFAPEPSSSEVCSSVPNKNFTSTTYIFPENFFEPNQSATDNVGSTQPLLEFHLDGQADKQNSSLVDNAFQYDFLQANTFSDPLVASTAAEDPSMRSLYLSATAPSFGSYSYNHNLRDSLHLQPESRTQSITPGAMNMVGLQVRKDRWHRMAQPISATDAYQNPPMSNMGATLISAGAVPYSNQSFSPMGGTPTNTHSFSNPSGTIPFSNGFCYRPNYDTQHKTSNRAVASNAPILSVNVEYPLNQQTNSGLQDPQFMSYLSNDYAQGIPSILQSQANYNWKYPAQTTNSGLAMGPSVPAIFDSEGYYMKWNQTTELQGASQHTFYDEHGRINNVEICGTSSISATQPVSSSSVSRGMKDLRSPRKRRRESPSPVSDASASPLAGPSTVPAEPGSKQDHGTSYICRWDGCNRQLLRDTTKLSYGHHLDKYHDFRGNTDQTIIECRWMEPGLEPGTFRKCTEKLQKQSVIKHTAGKHLKLMTADCPLCGSSQARPDNMFRHFKSCDEFYALGEEEKKELWEVHTAQPFDEYTKSESARQNKTIRKKRKVSKSMKEQKP